MKKLLGFPFRFLHLNLYHTPIVNFYDVFQSGRADISFCARKINQI